MECVAAGKRAGRLRRQMAMGAREDRGNRISVYDNGIEKTLKYGKRCRTFSYICGK